MNLHTGKGIRDKVIICAGGTQVTPEIARNKGWIKGLVHDKEVHVANFFVTKEELIESGKWN